MVGRLANDDSVEAAAQVIRRRSDRCSCSATMPHGPDCSDLLSQFVHRVRIPYFTTQMGKGSVSGSSDLYMGTAALTKGDYVHDAVEKADVIVTIGHDTTEKPPFTMDENGPTVVHVGYRAAVVEQVYFPQVEVVGDLGPISSTVSRWNWSVMCPNAGALLPMRAGHSQEARRKVRR